MELRDFLRIVRRGWAAIVVLALLGAVSGAAVGLLQPQRYAASTRAFVSVASAQAAGDLTSGATYAQQAAQRYAGIASTAYILQPVIRRLALPVTVAQLAGDLRVTAAVDAPILEITVEGDSAAAAAATTDAIAQQLSTAAVRLASGTSGVATVKLTPVDPAAATRVGLTPVSAGVLGALAGVVAALLLSLLRELLDTRVRSRQDLERVTALPVLGTTVRDGRVARRPLLLDRVAHDPHAERFRTLRTNLRFVRLDTARSLVVTSSIEGEGKSVTAANLALAVAALGRRVLLVDADLRRPRVAQYFEVEGAIGLTDVLIGSVALDEAVQPFGDGGLHLLPAGSVPPNPNEQLQSRAMRELAHRLSADYDLVLFDTPPVLAVSDALVLGEDAGAVIVVAASGRVRRVQLTEALQRLERGGARVAGLVLTMVPPTGSDGRLDAYGPDPRASGEPTARTKRKRGRRPEQVGVAASVDAGATELVPEHEDHAAPEVVVDRDALRALLREEADSGRPADVEEPSGTEVPAPVPALRQFVRPALWDGAPVVRLVDAIEASTTAAPISETTPVEAAEMPPLRRSNWRAAIAEAAVADAPGETGPALGIPQVDLLPAEAILPAAVEPDLAPEPLLEDSSVGLAQEPDPAAGVEPSAAAPDPAPRGRRRGLRPAAVKPVRIPPPPELVARLGGAR